MAFPGALSSFVPSPSVVKVAELDQYPKSPFSSGSGGEKSTFNAKHAVKNCVLFEGLTPSETKFVLQTARALPTMLGLSLYEQDDTPNYFFLVESGTYRAMCSTADGSRKARDYGPLDNFGACELLSPIGGRTCTIEVLTPGRVWAIPMSTVQVKLRVPPPLASPGLFKFCRSVKLFREISNDRLLQLCRGAVQLRLRPGEAVFEENSDAREIYALRDGALFTRQSDSDFSMTMTPPESFGESALFPDDDLRVRRATILAGEQGAIVVRWSVSAIETLIGFELQAASLALFNRKMLESVSCARRTLVEGLKKDDMDMLIGAMHRKTFEVNDVLAEEGEFDSHFFIIESGEAIVKKGEGTKSEVLVLRRGDCFGEQALVPPDKLRRQKRKTSIIAKGPTSVMTLMLSADDFNRLRGPMGNWVNQFATDIASNSMGGIDSVITAKAVGSLSTINPQTKKDQKAGNKAEKRTTSVRRAAPLEPGETAEPAETGAMADGQQQGIDDFALTDASPQPIRSASPGGGRSQGSHKKR